MGGITNVAQTPVTELASVVQTPASERVPIEVIRKCHDQKAFAVINTWGLVNRIKEQRSESRLR